MTLMVKNIPVIQETWVQSLGREDPLQESMATHSSILAWRIPDGFRGLVGHSPWGHRTSSVLMRTDEHILYPFGGIGGKGRGSNF